MRIVAIDPGILNLAWVAATLTFRPLRMTVDAYGNEDVTRPCAVRGCELRHTRELWDRLAHVDAHTIRAYAAVADRVLLERQPPGGLGEVTGFFYSRYPTATFVHPRSVHKFLGIGGFGYDGRKVMSVKIARAWIPALNCGPDRRTHDVADAACMAWFWANQQVVPVMGPDKRAVVPEAWMDVFRHEPALLHHHHPETEGTRDS
jgi:hypothetical protein